MARRRRQLLSFLLLPFAAAAGARGDIELPPEYAKRLEALGYRE